MNKPINRTTVQVGENKFKVYPKESPLFYKNREGKFSEIDLTFNDAKSSIGDISLMDKGVVSVGIRKGNNPNKIVGIRPDNALDGYKQLEFSLINTIVDEVEQEVNVENDFEVKVKLAKVFQFVKIKKDFGKCEINFDIHIKNLDIVNPKYTKTTKLYDYNFTITNIGENNGSTTLGLYNSYSSEKSDTSSFDCFVGKITDDYITTGEYSNEEEFGDSDLSSYTLEKMYPYGSSVYFKDCIVFASKVNNIDNYEKILVSQICDLYGFETIHEDNINGQYFTKDNKKIGGYYSVGNTFLSFFNTTEIPDSIKTLFKRKTFESTSFINITVDKLKSDIESRLNKDLTIKVDTDYYQSINSSFYINMNKESIKIGLPLAFDKDFNDLEYLTTHTLKDNKDGTYRYTKLLQPTQALMPNKAKYIDVALAVGNGEDAIFRKAVAGSANPKTATNLNTMRDDNAASSADGGEFTSGLTTFTTDQLKLHCGETFSRSQTGGSQGAPIVVTRNWTMYQSHFYFDTSSIVATVTDAKFKFKEIVLDNTTGLSPEGVNCILLKSTYDGTPDWNTVSPPTGHFNDYNDFVGHTSGWDSSDVTEYSLSTLLDEDVNATSVLGGATADDEVSLNSSGKSDIQSLSAIGFAMVENNIFYDNDFSEGINGNFGVPTTVTYTHGFYSYQVDHSTVSNRPYLEVTTGTAPATPTENATFFGANF